MLQFANTKNLILPRPTDQMVWATETYDMTAGVQKINMAYENAQKPAVIPQALQIDSTNMTGTCQIAWDPKNINKIINIPPNCQATFLIPAIDPPTYDVIPGTGAGGTLRVDLINFPAIPGDNTLVDSSVGKNVTVTNPVTAPANTAPVVAGAVVAVANPLPAAPVVAGAVVSTANPLPVNQTLATATMVYAQLTGTGGNLPAPPANSNLRRLRLTLSENATLAAAGLETILVTCNGVDCFFDAPFLPATALADGTVAYKADIDFDNVVFNAGAAGLVTVTLGTALATGQLNAVAYFD